MEDTIFSLATPSGMGAIAIVRISGSKAKQALETIFTGEIQDHKLCYGDIKYNGQTIDKAMAVFMQAPKTYTREDVVEFHLHGSISVIRSLLKILSELGLRQAISGEFTKRAFLNGRVDLSQAEAVMEMISSSSTLQSQVATRQLEGSVEKYITSLCDKLLDCLAKLDVCIDYPEEDIEDQTSNEIKQELQSIILDINNNVSSKLCSSVLSSGYKIAIIGKPNVGKSSLLNRILGKDRVIVTDVAGTTRDTLSERFTYDGMLFTFVDTAGIRQSDDKIEAMGIERSIKAIQEANLVLSVFDGNLNDLDKEVIDRTKTVKHINVINKCDTFSNSNIDGIHISAKENINIEVLLKEIKNIASEDIGDIGIITNNRHIELCTKAIECFNEAIIAIDNSEDVECIEIHIRQGYSYFCEITGSFATEDIINRIFEKFCLGK